MDRKSRYLHESQLKSVKKGLNCAMFCEADNNFEGI